MYIKVKNALKRAFCRHSNIEIIHWHEVRMPDHKSIHIEAMVKCNKCGTEFFDHYYHPNDIEFVKMNLYDCHSQNSDDYITRKGLK